MEEQKEQNIEDIKDEKPNKRPFKRFIGLGVGLVVAVAAGFFVHDILVYQSTDDAYVETTTVQVAPRVNGQITEVYITDNQKVKEGDLVAKIDPADYEIALAQAEARYERTLLNQKNAQANFKASQTNIEVAKKDLERYKNLYAQGAVSKQTLDQAQAKYDSAQANLTQSDEALLSEGGKKVADADLKEIKALRDKAKLNLGYTNIYAPQSGTVSSRRVEKGMYVNVGTPLFTIVPENVWIVANYKENQLRHMKVGQEVEIKIDTYPNHKFKGKVDSIQRASGAKSSLFPPENAVGSFVKIVQRIPVKIVFTEKIDPNEYNIVPGMSVEPKVRVK
jgi:membrane fusion protein (multidrug efflux system)